MRFPLTSTSLPGRGLPLYWLGALALACVLSLLLVMGFGTAVMTLMIVGVLGTIFFYNRTLAALSTLFYVAIVGDVRRIRDVTFSHPSLDLLLLIGPLIATLLALPILLHIRLRDPLSKAMLALMAIMIVEIFNPAQGGISVGLGGVIFFIIPVFWFWIGREYGTVAVTEAFIYKVLLPLGIVAMLLGLYQTFVGPLPYQQAWIDQDPINAKLLDVGHGALRSFGFANSASEHATLLAMTAAATAAAGLGKKKIWVLLFPLNFVTMLFLGSRGVFVKLVLALAALWAVRKGKELSTGTIIRLVMGLAVLFGTIYFVALRFAPDPGGTDHRESTASAAMAHEAGGFANVGDEKHSTAGLHGALILDGILQGFSYPIGKGLGYTTSASSKFGGGGYSSEIDLSDAFMSFGVFGGLLYLFIIGITIRNMFRYLRIAPLTVSLPVMAILTVTFGVWLLGGQYFVAACCFFLIGALANPTKNMPARQKARSRPSLVRTQPVLPSHTPRPSFNAELDHRA